MRILRSQTNRIELPTYATLEGGYFLLWFQLDSNTSIDVFAVAQNLSSEGRPVVVVITEIGTGSPVSTDGEVLLEPGNWTLRAYEQVGGSNTNPDCASRFITTLAARVQGAAATSTAQTPTTCSSGESSADWGDIGGTLSDQTDLNDALGAKADSVHTHTAAQISNSTAAGRTILTASDADAQISALGGTAAGSALFKAANVAAQKAALAYTKSDVGLSNADNTADASKPVSTATQAALDAKANTAALPLVYTAVVTSSDPTPTVAQERNQLGGAPAWTSNGQAGNSILTIADAFVNDRTNCQISGNDTSTPGNTYAIRRVDANTIEIACWDTSESLSELTVNVRIEVLPA